MGKNYRNTIPQPILNWPLFIISDYIIIPSFHKKKMLCAIAASKKRHKKRHLKKLPQLIFNKLLSSSWSCIYKNLQKITYF